MPRPSGPWAAAPSSCPIFGRGDLATGDFVEFLETAHRNQCGNRQRFPQPYSLIERVDNCFVRGVENLIDPKPAITGLFSCDLNTPIKQPQEWPSQANDDNRMGNRVENRAQPQLAFATREIGCLAVSDITRMMPTKIGALPSCASPTERSIGNTDPSLRRPTTSWPIPMIFLRPVRR